MQLAAFDSGGLWCYVRKDVIVHDTCITAYDTVCGCILKYLSFLMEGLMDHDGFCCSCPEDIDDTCQSDSALQERLAHLLSPIGNDIDCYVPDVSVAMDEARAMCQNALSGSENLGTMKVVMKMES